MINVLIVEDEIPASHRLKTILQQSEMNCQVIETCQTVEEAVNIINNSSPDLAFFDIQLADGLVFEVFDYCEINFPVIFLTAYNQYALKAFEVNGFDYLLKPISLNSLKKSMNKLDNLFQDWNKLKNNLPRLITDVSSEHKSRFLVKIRDHLISLPVTDIAFFYSFQKSSFCITSKGAKHLLDMGIDKIEQSVNPINFFRANRQHLISFNSIKDIIVYSNSRFKVLMEFPFDQEVIVARERAADFKKWLDR